MAKKKTKKEEKAELVAPDPFQETANRGADWVQSNLKAVLGVLTIIALSVAGALVFQQQSVRSASELTAQLTKAADAYQAATDPQTVATTTVAGALEKSYAEALTPYQKLASEHAGSGIGDLALLYAADLERRLGKHADAESKYKAYLSKKRPKDPLAFLAIEGVGYALEEQGKQDEALTYFTQLTALPDGLYKDYGYKHVARMHELKGEKDKAIAAYKAILDEMAESKLRDFAEARLAELE